MSENSENSNTYIYFIFPIAFIISLVIFLIFFFEWKENCSDEFLRKWCSREDNRDEGQRDPYKHCVWKKGKENKCYSKRNDYQSSLVALVCITIFAFFQLLAVYNYWTGKLPVRMQKKSCRKRAQKRACRRNCRKRAKGNFLNRRKNRKNNFNN